MSKVSLQAFYAGEVKQVKELEAQFAVEQQLYDTAAKALQTVVAE